jgi:hypothetical protein
LLVLENAALRREIADLRERLMVAVESRRSFEARCESKHQMVQ